MLLPSDVARLVLGYLQEEGLSATSRAFIRESPNLKEYAEHSTEDGAIPACVFSLFGKGLTTILNEYVAAKAKESIHEVPAMMASMWKKLEFTLNQIKSLLNSPAISASQRMRSRVGVRDLRRQRTSTLSTAGSIVCAPAPKTSPIINPVHPTHSVLGHSTPGSYTTLQTRPASVSDTHFQIQEGDSPVQMLVPEHRLTPGPMSPGRRKWKRGSGLSGSSGTGRSTMNVSSLAVEPQPEEVVDENFPQLVIENAREKILGDRSLQEKLAENINKILACDPTPQTSKASCSTVEPDQSIDEILGLQGEIHMSDDAIHDILEQTESDPAFQALFDLFDYNKTRITEGELGYEDISSSPEESETAGPSSADRPPQNEDPATTHTGVTSAPDTTLTAGKVRTGQELKTRTTRKSAAPSSSKKTTLTLSGRRSRIENSTSRVLVSPEKQPRVSSSAAVYRGENVSLFSGSDTVVPMDVDEPLNTPPPPSDSTASQEVLEPSRKGSFSTAGASITIPTRSSLAPSAAPETIFASNVNNQTERTEENTNARAENKAQFAIPAPPVPSYEPSFVSPAPDKSNKTLTQTANLPQMRVAVPSSGADLQPQPVAPKSASSTSASDTAPVAAKPKPPTINPSTPSKGSSDSSNIVSLKIIICDDQDEASSSDVALSQAISSISTDKIPTIFLSSPAKATVGPPGTPSANQDETAQAVSSLQSSEVLQPTGTEANPLSGKTGVAVVSTLAGASQAQPSYIIQLPLDTTNPALPGSTTSYFLLTDPTATDPQARQVLLPTGISKGQPLPPSQYTLATPPRSQGFSTGSTLILQSPGHGQPMMLPVSVMAQSTLGKFQMVSNQLVAIPSPLAIQQSETVQPKTPTVMLKQSTVSGITGTTEENSVSKVVPSLSTENPGQKVPAGTGPSVTPRIGDGHRRILCFDSSGEAPPSHPTKITTTSTPPAENTQISRSVQLSEKDNPPLAPRTKPAILSGNKPKRRIEAVRCSDDTQAGLGFETEKETEKSMPPKQQQKDPVRKTLRKQDHKIHDQKSQSASASRVDISEPESLKKSESGGRSKAIDRNHRNNDCNQVKSKDSHSSRSLSSDYIPKSGSRKEKEEASKKEPAEKAPAKSREGRAEKRTSSQVEPNVTANKENEVEGSRQEQQQQSTPSSAPREFSPPSVIPPTPTPQSKSSKIPSKTSSLAKQAAEMLQDIQGLNSPSTPVKKPGVGYSDLPLPRTPGSGCNEEDIVDCPRTPARQRQGREGEVTPRHLLPPTTPELPTCSPASEAGSENSINMAAHTLMILSRAAIARTGTPLKDSLRQEGVGKTPPATSKKKRKLMSPPASPPAKKESKGSVSSKKQEKKQKKLLDYFPDNLDVDKFLSSLHYDE